MVSMSPDVNDEVARKIEIDVDLTIGPKVEQFYLCYSSSVCPASDQDETEQHGDLSLLADCLQNVEMHRFYLQEKEAVEVIDEIVRDCRRKFVSVVKGRYTKVVSTIVSNARKKLVSKTSKVDGDRHAGGAQAHSNRHFLILMELLEQWCTLFMTISDLGISLPTLHDITISMHNRVIEVSIELMKQFQKDKHLDNWYRHILELSTQGVLDRPWRRTVSTGDREHTVKGEEKVVSTVDIQDLLPFNLITLDRVVGQAADMKELVTKYYSFLTAETSISLDLVTLEESQEWKVVDMMYMHLETGYLMSSVFCALHELALVEMCTGVYVPQAIEDTFFLINKVVTRCLSTRIPSALFSIVHKVLDLLDPAKDDGNEMDGDSVGPLLWLLVSHEKCFKYCTKTLTIYPHRLVDGLVIEKDVEGGGEKRWERETEKAGISKKTPRSVQASPSHPSHNGDSSSTGGNAKSTISSSSTGTSTTVSDSNNSSSNSLVSNMVGSELAEDLSVLREGASALVDAAGSVTSWFTSNTDNKTPSASNTGMVNGDGGSSDGSRPADLSSALIAAFEQDIDSYQHTNDMHLESDPGGGLNLAGLVEALGGLDQEGADPILGGAKGAGLFGGQSIGKKLFHNFTSMVDGNTTEGADQGEEGVLDDSEHRKDVNPFRLNIADWCVVLNSRHGIAMGLQRVRAAYDRLYREVLLNYSAYIERERQVQSRPYGSGDGNTTNDGSGDGGSSSSVKESVFVEEDLCEVLSTLHVELVRVETLYIKNVLHTIEDLFLEPFYRHMGSAISDVLCAPFAYNIDSQTFDRRKRVGSTLVGIVSSFVHVIQDTCSDANIFSSFRRQKARIELASSGSVSHNSTNNTPLKTGSSTASDINISMMDLHVRPYCCAAVYNSILHRLAIYLCEQLVLDIIHNNSDGFNEWGALLLQEEILNIIEIFERASEECMLTELDIGPTVDAELVGLINMRNEYKREVKEKKREKERQVKKAGAAIVPSTTTGDNSSNKDGKDTGHDSDGLINIRSRFHTVTWTCRLLCLDRPGDVNRYQVPSAAFIGVAGDLGLEGAEGVVRKILSKKVEFARENVERCELLLT